LYFAKKKVNVGVTGLEILGVSTGFDDVASDDDLLEAPMVGDFLTAFSELDSLWAVQVRLKRMMPQENSHYLTYHFRYVPARIEVGDR